MRKTIIVMAVILMALSVHSTPVAPYLPPAHPFAPQAKSDAIYFNFSNNASDAWLNFNNTTTGDDFDIYIPSGQLYNLGPITAGTYIVQYSTDVQQTEVWFFDGSLSGGDFIEWDNVSSDEINGQTMSAQFF